jgi:two-component system sensor histidine kinase KdpD
MTSSTKKALTQYFVSLLVIALITSLGLGLLEIVGHRVIGFMFLFPVTIMALFMDIRPVVVAASISVIAWNYLFIPPRFTLTIGDTEDRLLLLTYFLVVMIHAVLTHRIRSAQNEARNKEVKTNALKFYNTLLNSLSHELRTPITTIIGATDNLQSNGNRISSEDKQTLLSEISIASLRLNEQVENLLNMSRLESGVIELKKDWVDIKELIYTTLNKFEPAITKWNTRIDTPESMPLFKLDFGLMEQVLRNLISNILQHTPEGTDVSIHADCRDDTLILSVADGGKGFPEADIEKVFERFYKVKGSSPGGTGLGLSIVKGFVEAHGGTVRLRNLPLIGAEIRIEIPAEMSYLTGLKNE